MGRKKFTVLIVLILIISTAGGLSAARKKRVAVLNFANYGPKSIAFLKNALPESLSSSLSEVKEIRVIERRQLGRVINELALEQTGMINTRGVNRTGRLARADILILGSISGSKKKLIVTMKAVEVRTGKVLDGKVVQASMGNVFDRSGEAARTMAAIISGKGIGRLSVSTVPAEAKVYVDGMYIGETPVVEYKVIKGDHRVKIVKKGYLEYETSVNIAAGEIEQVANQMSVDSIGNRSQLDFIVMYMQPFDKRLDYGLYFAGSYGLNFNRFIMSFEFGVGVINHDQVVERIPNVWTETIIRQFLMLSLNAQISYSLFPYSWAISRYVQPYIGGIISYTPLVEYRGEAKEKMNTSNFFGLGAKAGANLFPFSRFSLFAEVRFNAYFPKLLRDNYTGDGGDLTKNEEHFFLYNMSIGGGARIFF